MADIQQLSNSLAFARQLRQQLSDAGIPTSDNRMPPQSVDEYANSFADYYIDEALAGAQRSMKGDWSQPYSQLPLELFAELKPEDRELYMQGLRHLPDDQLSVFFGYMPGANAKWTNFMIDEKLQPYMDIHLTGRPARNFSK